VTSGVEDEFALSEVPEFVRSGDGFCADAPLKLEVEELTDIGVAGVAAPLRRAASWVLVTQTRLGTKERLAVGAAKNRIGCGLAPIPRR
jgi:hypothetical protein